MSAQEKPELRVWQFLDGLPGHEKQSDALVAALSSRADLDLLRISWSHEGSDFFSNSMQRGNSPDLLIGAGHSIHVPLLRAKWKYGAKAVLLMKPTLPTFLFDLVLVPEHDRLLLKHNVFRIEGALAKGSSVAASASKGIILLGGPSRHFSWQPEKLIEQIDRILKRDKDISWTIANSRRTPEIFSQLVETRLKRKIVYWRDVDNDWLENELAQCGFTWVTPDSISMVYEALTTQGRVGIFDMNPLGGGGKVSSSIDRLVKAGRLGRSSLGSLLQQLETFEPLQESHRCAQHIIDTWFKNSKSGYVNRTTA